jgi:hypothetical protein
MVYQVTVFRQLCEQFSSWDLLKTFLQSEQGGQLRIIENDTKFAIIRYEKGSSNFLLPYVRWFRSVVWNKETNRPVCVAPPKASHEKDAPLSTKRVYQEYLDGIMINCFKDSDGVFHTVTRSSFGATGTFYSQKSFNELLTDAVEHLKQKDNNPEFTLEKWLPWFDCSQSVCMSILLQHPEHRVVNRVIEPTLYLVHQACLYDDGTVIMNEDMSHHSIPVLEGPTNGEEFSKWFGKQVESHSWDWQGVTMKDGQGNRWRVRSNVYRMIRSMRGNTPHGIVRFSQLFTSNMMDTYLYYYPEDRLEFLKYYNQLLNIKKTLYEKYVGCHITKTIKWEYIHAVYKPHIFSIHGMYLYTLKPKKQFIREKDVGLYLQALPWQQLQHLLVHWKKRQDELQQLASAFVEPVGETI